MQEKRKADEKAKADEPTAKKPKVSKAASKNTDTQQSQVAVTILDDDNYVTMDVTSENVRKTFPNAEEDGKITTDNELDLSQNISATVTFEQPNVLNPRTLGSSSALLGDETVEAQQLPDSLQINPPRDINVSEDTEMKKTLRAVQNFMVKKGLIQFSLDDEEISELIHAAEEETQPSTSQGIGPKQVTQQVEYNNNRSKSPVTRSPLQAVSDYRDSRAKAVAQPGMSGVAEESSSDITFYKRAVRRANLELDNQIDILLEQTRLDDKRKESSSSDELLNSSDELPFNILSEPIDTSPQFLSDVGKTGKSSRVAEIAKTPDKESRDHAEKMMLDAEVNKG